MASATWTRLSHQLAGWLARPRASKGPSGGLIVTHPVIATTCKGPKPLPFLHLPDTAPSRPQNSLRLHRRLQPPLCTQRSTDMQLAKVLLLLAAAAAASCRPMPAGRRTLLALPPDQAQALCDISAHDQ